MSFALVMADDATSSPSDEDDAAAVVVGWGARFPQRRPVEALSTVGDSWIVGNRALFGGEGSSPRSSDSRPTTSA